MDYDILIRTFDLGNDCFAMLIAEVATGKLLYLSPPLDASTCAAAVLHMESLARAQDHRVQVRICAGLAMSARQAVTTLN